MRTRFRRPLRLAGAFLLLAAAGCATREAQDDAADRAGADRVAVTEAAPDTGSDPMIVALTEAFTARNPEARRVSIVEFRREPEGGGANLVLARGARPGSGPRGRPEDELFGVFVFDDSLRRVLRTVAMLPAPRPGATEMRFDRASADSVWVFGWASVSGETLLTAGYPWRGRGAH